jgi:hypothetical protein
VIPSEIYAPNCIVKNVVTNYVAGTLSFFDIQGRDFYSNNIVVRLSVAVTDYTLEFRNQTSNETVSVGTVVDQPAIGPYGSFRVSFTPTIAGKFNMHLMFNGLEIDTSPYEVLVTPALATNAASSTIVNINSKVHTTGESLVFIIESRDQFSNLRTTSLTDVYVVTLTGETSGTVYTAATPVANKNGTYTAKFMFTIAESYTLQVKLGGVNVKATPIADFKVNVGLAQAKYSQLVVSKSPLIAGHNYTFKI